MNDILIRMYVIPFARFLEPSRHDQIICTYCCSFDLENRQNASNGNMIRMYSIRPLTYASSSNPGLTAVSAIR